METNRVELRGRLVDAPELRVTPAGTPVLRITVECVTAGERLALGVVMAGEEGRAVASGLKRGSEVTVMGRLRALQLRGGASAGVEVVAARIEPGIEN